MLEEILAFYGYEPEEAVMIGDTRYDLDMAQRIGMPSIGVEWGVHKRDVLGEYSPTRSLIPCLTSGGCWGCKRCYRIHWVADRIASMSDWESDKSADWGDKPVEPERKGVSRFSGVRVCRSPACRRSPAVTGG